MKYVFSILIVPLLLIAAADDADRFAYENAQKVSSQSQPYGRMHVTVKVGGEVRSFDRYGRLEEAVYAYKSGGDADSARRALLKHLGYRGDTSDRQQQYFLMRGSPETWLYLNVARDRYTAAYLEVAPYPETVSLDASAPYAYSERLRQLNWTVPPNALIPQLRDYVITDAQYKRRDRFRFETGAQSEEVEGELWQLRYEWRGEGRGDENRYAVLHHYRDALRMRGAEILFEDLTHFVFRVAGGAQTTWGVFGSSGSSAGLVLVRRSEVASEGILDVNALKNALDASGHVALKGIYFDTGEATLKPESEPALNAAAGLMRRFPDLRLTVEGHTDNTGDAEKNLRLSEARAAAVKRALEAYGIAAARLDAAGYGASKPVASNDDETGRALNRRGELRQSAAAERTVRVDASFFRPNREAVTVEERHIAYDTLRVPTAPPYTERKQNLTVRGDATVVRYILLRNGQRDRSVSGYELQETLGKHIKALGGRILNGIEERLYFVIPEEKGSPDVYGTVETADGAYSVYTISAEETVDEDAARRSKDENNTLSADKNNSKQELLE